MYICIFLYILYDIFYILVPRLGYAYKGFLLCSKAMGELSPGVRSPGSSSNPPWAGSLA